MVDRIEQDYLASINTHSGSGETVRQAKLIMLDALLRLQYFEREQAAAKTLDLESSCLQSKHSLYIEWVALLYWEEASINLKYWLWSGSEATISASLGGRGRVCSSHCIVLSLS